MNSNITNEEAERENIKFWDEVAPVYYKSYDIFYNGHPGMKQDENGWWYLKKYKGKIPYTFTIKARKMKRE